MCRHGEVLHYNIIEKAYKTGLFQFKNSLWAFKRDKQIELITNTTKLIEAQFM